MNNFLTGCLIFFLSSVILLPIEAIGSTPASPDRLVQNVRFVPSENYVTIKYNLLGPQNATYTVRLILKRTSDSSYVYIPRDVSGDVGSGILAGDNRQIVWGIRDEFPSSFKGDDFYFELDAHKISKGTEMKPWIGVVMAAASAAIFFYATSLITTGHGK